MIALVQQKKTGSKYDLKYSHKDKDIILMLKLLEIKDPHPYIEVQYVLIYTKMFYAV